MCSIFIIRLYYYPIFVQNNGIMSVLRIKEVLREKEITITDLANRLSVNRQTVYYYIEQDDKNPICQVQRIADAIGVSLFELIKAQDNSIKGFVKLNDVVYEINSKEDLLRVSEGINT